MKPLGMLAWLLCLGLLAVPVLADDPPLPDDGDKAKTTKEKQEEARQKLDALEETMNRVARLLEKTEPEQAVLLRQAYRQSKEEMILQDMDEILEFLKKEKIDEAIQRQKDVGEKLRKLLVLLLDREEDLEDLLERIKRLEGYQKELERLIQEETGEKTASDRTADAAKKLAAIEQAKQDLEELIERQETQVASTGDLAGVTGPKAASAFEGLRESQEGIREDTDELAFSIEEVLGKSGEEEAPSKTGEALARSSESMAEAEGRLGEGEQGPALESGEKALEELRQAMKALEEEEKETRKLLALPEFEEMKKAQDGTKGDTDSLAQKMKEEGGEEGTPGQENVGKAGGSMGKASENLGNRKAGKASGNQQEALDQLQDAKEEVEDALEQARRELQEEVLAMLEERFLDMLAEQKAITKKTGGLDEALAGAAPDRAQQQTIHELSGGETDLASDSDEALKLLREEGSTVIFPQVVEEMKGDLVNVAGLLASSRTDEFTQAIQKEIEETLEQLIEAIRKKQEHLGSCDGCGGG